jgi:hypothetical protein
MYIVAFACVILLVLLLCCLIPRSDTHRAAYCADPLQETHRPFATDASPDDLSVPSGDRPTEIPRGVYSELGRLYSSADVDPLMTGQAFAYRDYTRPIYDQRTSHGGIWGMQEFSSSGNPGDVGVDVGPDGLVEYAGSSGGYDDGIPEQWRLPGTPVRWYKPRQRDYYGPEGPTPYADGVFGLTVADHDPLIGIDHSPDS